ncbi:MAG: stage II sporulation protein M [Crocinitomicaceae bacterium]|nr:stage II sporulation protein M [Crocinitomicaceae bacterium]
MKETSFIEQNKEKWNRFEKMYESKSNDPEELSDLYMDITDDLSYAQTFYKRRTVRVYLNQLGQKVYTGVHKQKGESFKKFFTVWRVSLPLEIYRSRKNLLFALVLFFIYATIGAVTTHYDPFFLNDVVGDGYVEMTTENIRNGDPLGVYSDDRQMDMFLRIATNNLRVAFITFFFGFFFTIGSHILLFSNSVMVGSFQYFFATKGMLLTSFLGIWIHGAFEISAIVLAAGAGITAGNGMLFPGSYTRPQALQLSTKRGLKIMLSLVPFIIVAGFLESFVTANYKELPDWSKWVLIMLSFGIILFYYVFYPMYIARKHPELLNKEEVPGFQTNTKFNFSKIRTIGEMVADSFRLYRKLFSRFTRINFLIVLPIITMVVYWQDVNHYDLQTTRFEAHDWAIQLELMIGYCFINGQDVIVFGIWTFIFAMIFTSVLWSVKSMDEEQFSWRSFFQYVKKRYLAIWLANFLLCVLVLALPWYFLLLGLAVFPLFYLNAATMGLDNEKLSVRFSRGFKYSSKQYGNGILAMVIISLLVFMAAQPIALVLSVHDGFSDEPIMPDLLDMVAGFVKRIAMIYTDDYMIWSNVLRQIVYVIFIIMIIPILVLMMSFGYYNELEKNEAKGLRKSFEKFGKRSRSRETDADFD